MRGADRAQGQRPAALARGRGAEQDVVAPEEVGREAILRVRDEAGGAWAPFGLGAGLALFVVRFFERGGGEKERMKR